MTFAELSRWLKERDEDELAARIEAMEQVIAAAREVDEHEGLPSMPLRKREIEAMERLEGCHQRLHEALAALDRIREGR